VRGCVTVDGEITFRLTLASPRLPSKKGPSFFKLMFMSCRVQTSVPCSALLLLLLLLHKSSLSGLGLVVVSTFGVGQDEVTHNPVITRASNTILLSPFCITMGLLIWTMGAWTGTVVLATYLVRSQASGGRPSWRGFPFLQLKIAYFIYFLVVKVARLRVVAVVGILLIRVLTVAVLVMMTMTLMLINKTARLLVEQDSSLLTHFLILLKLDSNNPLKTFLILLQFK
jgi:hypothetical protein